MNKDTDMSMKTEGMWTPDLIKALVDGKKLKISMKENDKGLEMEVYLK